MLSITDDTAGMYLWVMYVMPIPSNRPRLIKAILAAVTIIS